MLIARYFNIMLAMLRAAMMHARARRDYATRDAIDATPSP